MEDGAVAPGARGHSDRLLAIAFVLGLAAHAAIILAVPYFPTVDGPAHLGAATALWDVLLGRSDVIERYVTVQAIPFTNVIPDVPLGFLAVTIGPNLADKLVLVGFVIGLPTSLAWVIRGIDPRRWWLAFAVVPLSFTFAMHYGFYAFCYGLIGLLLVTGHVVRSRDRWTVGRAVVLAILVTATYTAHVLAFGLTVFLLVVLAAVELGIDGRSAWRDVLRRWSPAALAILPGAILALDLVAIGLTDTRSDLVQDGRTIGAGSAPLVKLAGVLSLGWGTVTFDAREVAWTASLAAMLALLALVAAAGRFRPFRLQRDDAFAIFGLVLVAAIVLLPAGANFAAGGSHLGQRLAPVSAIMLLVWLAAQPLSLRRPRPAGRLPALVAVVSLVVAVGLAATRIPAYLSLSGHLEAMVPLTRCMATETTMVQVNLARIQAGPLDRTWQLTGETGRFTSLLGGWDLGNIESALPFFQLRNRPSTDPYRYLVPAGDIQGTPPTIDPRSYAAATPGQVDYVLVFGRTVAEPADLASAGWQNLATQLREDYTLVAVSTDRWLEVYETDAEPVASAGAARRARAGGACGPITAEMSGEIRSTPSAP